MKMDDNPNFLKMEDNPNFLKMEDDLNFFENGRRPQLFDKWKMNTVSSQP
jgi:hypothetical protein